MRPGEADNVASLIERVFRGQVAPTFSSEGVREFLAYAAPDAIQRRPTSGHFVLVAVIGQQIVGAIEARDHNHVSLLFVDPVHQRQGIGRGLVDRAVSICRAHEPGLQEISVHSSPNAVPAYQRLGFHAQGPERTIDGIRFVPMVLDLT
jgi:GNAT superfamily N-acetyltransferase